MKGITFSLMLLATMTLGRTAAQKSNKLTDAEIASVAVVANQVDIQAAEQGQQKTRNEAVRNFAHTMIQDHRSVIEKASALCQKLHVSPKNNALSKQLAAGGENTRRRLQSTKGAAFDKAYIDNEVAYHKAVIETVTNTLIPQTQNAELKSLLESVVPVLRTHLEHAEMVQKQMAGK